MAKKKKKMSQNKIMGLRLDSKTVDILNYLSFKLKLSKTRVAEIAIELAYQEFKKNDGEMIIKS